MKRFLNILALIVSASFCLQASATTITVINTNDSAAGSLRQALADAVDGDTIDFQAGVTGTLTLTTGQLVVDKSVTIDGPGADMLAVNGNGNGRVFYVGPGKTVTIAGLTITGGSSPPIGVSISGGGIYNDHSTLTVSNCNVSGNSAAEAGGIENDGTAGQATLTIENSTVSGNSCPSGGGGIENDGNFGGSATLTIENSTISGNSGGAGAIVNRAPAHGSATLTITNSTVSGNSAVSGGGIRNESATLTIGDTILNANTGVNISNDSGTVTSLGYNLSSDTGGGFLTDPTDKINTNPMLGALAYYGGPTPTHILLTGSPAIDQGKNLSGATTDQRGVGFPRTVDDGSIADASGGDGTDIGAFERQATDIDPTLVVTKTADTNDGTCDSDCSLREAITVANASAPDDVIYFAVTGTITLNSLGALPNLDSNMKILGPAANALTVKRDPGAAAFRIFTINTGKTVTISGLTITNGVDGVDLVSGAGAGIYNGGILTVNNSTLSGHSAGLYGGGVYNGGTLTVNNSTLSGNRSGLDGGGIFNPGTLTMNNSTLSGNGAVYYGGGIFNPGTLTVNNSTLSGNGVGVDGGGIYNSQGGSPTLSIGGTILKSASGNNIVGSSNGTVTSLGYNLSSDNGGGFLTNTGDQINTDPLLGPLQDNGGPTFTHALLPGSPAIDKGKNFSAATTDQRGPGFDRTFDDVSTANATGGDGTDIGAFEVQCTQFPPVITLKAAAVLKPFNHSYRTFTIAQMVQSATEACGGDLINSVVIEKATSDEVENSPDPGDGSTVNDIVIASDCKSVQLRSERDGTKDGRVYLVTVAVSDSSGNVGRATYKVSVPVGKNPAVDSGVHYTVTGCGP